MNLYISIKLLDDVGCTKLSEVIEYINSNIVEMTNRVLKINSFKNELSESIIFGITKNNNYNKLAIEILSRKGNKYRSRKILDINIYSEEEIKPFLPSNVRKSNSDNFGYVTAVDVTKGTRLDILYFPDTFERDIYYCLALENALHNKY